MTKYYGVEQKYYDNGKIDVKLIEKYANAKPLDIHKENIDSDYYVDWFVDKKDANNVLKMAGRAWQWLK